MGRESSGRGHPRHLSHYFFFATFFAGFFALVLQLPQAIGLSSLNFSRRAARNRCGPILHGRNSEFKRREFTGAEQAGECGEPAGEDAGATAGLRNVFGNNQAFLLHNYKFHSRNSGDSCENH